MKRHETVEELMRTAVLTIRANDTVAMAREQMALAEIRHLPIVDGHNHVVGVVSDRDLAQAGPIEPVRSVMHHPAHTVRPSTPAHQAASILRQHKIGSLPVVALDGTLIGIITVSDFLDVACAALGGDPGLQA
jgi:Mg/Co/Ni transporter MgtE